MDDLQLLAMPENETVQGILCQAVQRCNEECSRADRYMKCISLPDSILLRIVLEHFKKASSTFSPVSALVSKNINSEEKIIGIRYIQTHCYLNDYSFTATIPIIYSKQSFNQKQVNKGYSLFASKSQT